MNLRLCIAPEFAYTPWIVRELLRKPLGAIRQVELGEPHLYCSQAGRRYTTVRSAGFPTYQEMIRNISTLSCLVMFPVKTRQPHQGSSQFSARHPSSLGTNTSRLAASCLGQAQVHFLRISRECLCIGPSNKPAQTKLYPISSCCTKPSGLMNKRTNGSLHQLSALVVFAKPAHAEDAVESFDGGAIRERI